MKSKELLKFNERQSLVEIVKDGGNIEYCVCSYYDDNMPEGEKWCWGHYFSTMENAIKYMATECLNRMTRYMLIETNNDNEIYTNVFDTFTEAKEELDKRFNNYYNSKEDNWYCTYAYKNSDQDFTYADLDMEDIEYNDVYHIRLKIVEIEV